MARHKDKGSNDSELFLSQTPPSFDKIFEFEGCTPEIKQIFSFPYRCFYAIIDAHKNQLSHTQKEQLVHIFIKERKNVTRLIETHVKLCAGHEPKDRFAYYREYEELLGTLEKLFKESLFACTFNNDLDFLRFKGKLFSKINGLSDHQFVLSNRLSVMLGITSETFKNSAQALVNIGKYPPEILEYPAKIKMIEETCDEMQEELIEARDRLSERVKRFEKSEAVDTSGGKIDSQSMDSQNKHEDIVELKPNFCGIGLNINALIRKKEWVTKVKNLFKWLIYKKSQPK